MSVDQIVNHLSGDSLAPLKCSFSQPPMFPRALLVQIREEAPAEDHAPDVAHPTEDDHARMKIEMLKKKSSGKVPLLKLE